MIKLGKDLRTNATLAIIVMLICSPLQLAIANVPTDVDGDDSELIAAHLKESLNSAGLVSVEQHTGRLLFNPKVEKLNNMSLKKQFLIPAILVNQERGLKLVSEMPFSCFMLSANELAHENYSNYRQHQTLQYLQSAKSYPVSRALICEPAGKTAVKEWKRNLSLEVDADPFIFEEHVGDNGERFYYFLNNNGSFEMYF